MSARKRTDGRKRRSELRRLSELQGRRGSLRLELRIARRMALQSPGRSILIIFLVAIPIIGLAASATIQASNVATPAETVRYELGQMQARVRVLTPPDPSLRQNPINDESIIQAYDSAGNPKNYTSATPLSDPRSWLPAGTVVVPLRQTSVVVTSGGSAAYLSAVEGRSWDARFTGKFDLVAGHRPTAPDQILATAGALSRLRASIGDSVHISSPRAGDFTIVGEMTAADQPTAGLELFGAMGAFDGISVAHDLASTVFYVPTERIHDADLAAFNAHGATVMSREILLNPPDLRTLSDQFGTETDNGGVFLIYAFIFGGFGLFEVVLLAGAAFAVGARQQQRAIATLASIGGDRRTLFRVVSFGGIVLGLAGGIVGTALGIVGAIAFMNVSAAGQADRFPGVHLDWLSLVLIVAFSVVAGWVASALPARIAARVNVIAALRGAVRPPKPRKRTPVVGLILVGVGAAIALAGGIVITTSLYPHDQAPNTQRGLWMVVGGSIVLQVGAALVAPLILRGVSAILARGGVGARLGSRDAARNPGRSVPAVAAIMSTVFVAALAMSLVAGSELSQDRTYSYSAPVHTVSVIGLRGTVVADPASYADSVRQVFNKVLGVQTTAVLSSAPDTVAPGVTASGAAVTQVPGVKNAPFAVPQVVKSAVCPDDFVPTSQDARCPNPDFLGSSINSNGSAIWVGSVADFHTLVSVKPSAQSLQTLRSGGAVSFYPQFVSSGHLTLAWKNKEDDDPYERDTGRNVRTQVIRASVQQTPHAYGFGLFMSPSTAKALGISFSPNAIIARLDRAPTASQTDTLRNDLDLLSSGALYAQDEEGPPIFAAAWSWALLALSGLVALGSAAVAISLARADGRKDDATLYSLGSSPAARRSFGFWQAIVLVGSGTIIGCVLSLIPAWALSFSTGQVQGTSAIPFTPQWAQLALTAFGLPLAIAIGTWAFSRQRRFRGSSRVPIG
jgi:hypothetical protein